MHNWPIIKKYQITLIPQSYSGPPGLWLALIINPPFACWSISKWEEMSNWAEKVYAKIWQEKKGVRLACLPLPYHSRNSWCWQYTFPVLEKKKCPQFLLRRPSCWYHCRSAFALNNSSSTSPSKIFYPYDAIHRYLLIYIILHICYSKLIGKINWLRYLLSNQDFSNTISSSNFDYYLQCTRTAAEIGNRISSFLNTRFKFDC